jgi:hypothetical protein
MQETRQAPAGSSFSFLYTPWVFETHLPSFQGMPDKLDLMKLMDGVPSQPLPDGAIGSVPLDSMAEIKENLKQFTEATHCKASQVLTWIQNVEVSATDRSNKQLDSFSF